MELRDGGKMLADHRHVGRLTHQLHVTHWTVTQPGGLRAPGWSGKAGNRAPERRVSMTSRSPPPDPPLWCDRWAMHAGQAAASSRAGETGPPGPGLMRSPQGVSVEGGRCLTSVRDATVGQAC